MAKPWDESILPEVPGYIPDPYHYVFKLGMLHSSMGQEFNVPYHITSAKDTNEQKFYFIGVGFMYARTDQPKNVIF